MTILSSACVRLAGPLALCLAWACSSPDGAQNCDPGESIACASPEGCSGSQLCRADGSGYDACRCSNTMPTTTAQGGGASTTTNTQSPPNPSSGGVTSGATGGASSSSTTTSTSSTTCAPGNVGGLAYSPFKPPRHLGGVCTEDDIYAYYSECLYQGSCSRFLPGGTKQACGACLEPTALDREEYGPVIRLGSGSTSITQANSAGCLDLLGESACVDGVWTNSMCKYTACAGPCASQDPDKYQEAMTSCMMTARSSVCAATQPAVTCFANPNASTLCSGFNFAAQFVAVARVFCVESH